MNKINSIDSRRVRLTLRSLTTVESNRFYKQGIIKYRNYVLALFVIIFFLYNQPNIWSLISGFLFIVIGELIRLNGMKNMSSSKEIHIENRENDLKKKFLGTIIIYFGLSFMSFALFPYLQLLVLIFFSYQFYLMTKKTELKKGVYEEEISFKENFLTVVKNDKRTIQSELFFSLTFFLLWFFRRFA